jgi:hypothetical protein
VIIKQLREIALAGAGGDMQAEPSNFLLERDAIVAACRKREGEGLSSNDTVGRGGEGRLSYSALEGGVGRTLQLYLARAAAAAAAAPVSTVRATNRKAVVFIAHFLRNTPTSCHPSTPPQNHAEDRYKHESLGGRLPLYGGWRCNAWLCGRHLCLSAASASALEASCNS